MTREHSQAIGGISPTLGGLARLSSLRSEGESPAQAEEHPAVGGLLFVRDVYRLTNVSPVRFAPDGVARASYPGGGG